MWGRITRPDKWYQLVVVLGVQTVATKIPMICHRRYLRTSTRWTRSTPAAMIDYYQSRHSIYSFPRLKRINVSPMPEPQWYPHSWPSVRAHHRWTTVSLLRSEVRHRYSLKSKVRVGIQHV